MSSAAELQQALVAWGVSFEAAAGRAPTEKDKAESGEYQRLQRKYKKLRSEGRSDGRGDGRSDGRHRRGGDDGKQRRGRSDRDGSKEREGRHREREDEKPKSSGHRRRDKERRGASEDARGGATDASSSAEEVARLDRMMDQWEVRLDLT
jgi:hypothetical protein